MSKLWVKQTHKKHPQAVIFPSFQESARAWIGVAAAEASKYFEPYQKGKDKVAEFLEDLAKEIRARDEADLYRICRDDKAWDAFWAPLAAKHKLPKKVERQLKTEFSW